MVSPAPRAAASIAALSPSAAITAWVTGRASCFSARERSARSVGVKSPHGRRRPPSAPGRISALPPSAMATAAEAGPRSMPTAAPGPSDSRGAPSGSSIWNSFMGRDGRSDVEGFAAAAAAFFVGIAEGEAGLELVLDVVHLGADDEHRRLGIDQDGDALVLHDLVEFSLIVGVFERISQARAAARAHADPDAGGILAALGEQRLDALGRRFRHRHCLL